MVGGHSLQAVRLHARINEEFRSTFPLSLVVGSPTIVSQAQWLSGNVTTSTEDLRLVTLQPHGDRAPLIAVHGWGGTLYHFVDMARALAPHRPVLGLQPAAVEDPSASASVVGLARAYADSIIDRVPDGPIHLVGHSAGGWYAHAVAAELIERGRTVGLLAMFDTHAVGANVHWGLRLRLLPFQLPLLLADKLDRLSRPSSGLSRRALIRLRIEARMARLTRRGDADTVQEDGQADLYVGLAQRGFRPPRLPVAVDVFGPRRTLKLLQMTWRHYALEGVRSHPMLDTHHDFLRPEKGPQLAAALERALAHVETNACR
jgi:thioesterase domain-containing protein